MNKNGRKRKDLNIKKLNSSLQQNSILIPKKIKEGEKYSVYYVNILDPSSAS